MKVLAIDPGFGRCGVAVVEKNGGDREILIHSACIETSPKDAFADRLSAVAGECARLMELHSPDHIAMEKLFFQTNKKTAMQVAEVRGALIHAAHVAGIEMYEYSPGEVKSAVAGSGSADKTQIAKMVRSLIKIDRPIQHDDEYDAIAIGVTHLALVRSIIARRTA